MFFSICALATRIGSHLADATPARVATIGVPIKRGDPSDLGLAADREVHPVICSCRPRAVPGRAAGDQAADAFGFRDGSHRGNRSAARQV